MSSESKTESKPGYKSELLLFVQQRAQEDGRRNSELEKYMFYINEFNESWKLKNKKAPFTGKMSWGKYKGKTVQDVAGFDLDYLRWVTGSGYATNDLKEEIAKYT